jgi:DNA-binding HxlR family transcriptional regulator
MGTSVYTSLLCKDLQRKKGEIKALRKDLKELCALIRQREEETSALERILGARVPDFDPDSIKAVATQPKLTGIKWNSLTKAILACLREFGGPVRSDEITAYVIETTDRVVETRADQIIMRRCVHYRLKDMAKKGRVMRHHDPKDNKYGIWSLSPALSGQATVNSPSPAR